MVIKIQTKKKGIPVLLGDLEFLVGTSDADIEKYSRLHAEVTEVFSKVDEATTFEELHPVLERGYDGLLGEGSFAKVYEMDGSTINCADYLSAIYIGVFEEFEKMANVDTQKAKIDKYLKNKK